MLRTRVVARAGAGVLLGVLVVVSGCGAEKKAEQPEAKATASASPTAAEEADADGMKTVTVEGISLRVPATWTPEHDEEDGSLYFWLNPGKGERDGLVAVSIENSTDTADDYLRTATGKSGTLRQFKVTKTPVDVEGMGKGYRLHAVYQRNITDQLIVSTIDGLFVHVTYVPDPDPEHSGYADIVLSSVARKL